MGSGRGQTHRVRSSSAVQGKTRPIIVGGLSSKGRTVVYFRHGYEDQLEGELDVLREHFVVTDSLGDIQLGDRVLCRFSMLPFPDLLQEEVESRGAVLVHDAAAQDYLADMRSEERR